MTSKIAIIVPAYNEEAVLQDSANKLLVVLEKLKESEKISQDSYICFVDDGSVDKTWEIIENLKTQNSSFLGIKLSRNFGHQNALLAGLFNNDADAFVTIDADLQDDENAIFEMVDKFNEGCQIVLGVRNDRSSDSSFKRYSAEAFYKIIKSLGVHITFNHADFRLMGKVAVEELKRFSERNLFLRATIHLLGFKTDTVFYKRKPREKGETKYSLKKMLAFALCGITSFTIQPLRLALWFGVVTLLISFLLFIVSIILFLEDGDIPKFESLLAAIMFFGAVQLISVGVLGEYVGRTYIETKQRPNYIIEKQN